MVAKRRYAERSVVPESQPRPHIDCCYSGCIDGAICSIFTDTGWANVCLTHYPKVKPSKKSYAPNSLAVIEARRAYENSPDYRRKHGIARSVEDRSALEAELATVREKMSSFREPGSDDT